MQSSRELRVRARSTSSLARVPRRERACDPQSAVVAPVVWERRGGLGIGDRPPGCAYSTGAVGQGLASVVQDHVV